MAVPTAPTRPPAPGSPPGTRRGSLVRSAGELVSRRRRAALRRRRRRRLVVLWLVAAVLVGTGAFAAGLLAAPVDFATPPPPKDAKLLDVHGRLFATIRSAQIREAVPGSQIPKVMRNAIVAAEDEHFFQHSGVDPTAVLRAAWRDISGAPLQGGSTITQQYVKNVYLGDERTALRKLREAALAFRLEHHLTKQQILTRYLNDIYLGNGTYGVQAASKFYFGVPIQDLDLDPATGERSSTLALARASLLAGMGPAPSAWNPIHDAKAARGRQLYTLNRMVANGMISAQEASAAYGLGMPRIVARRTPDFPTVAPEFRDLVAERLRARFGDEEVDRGALTVTTTLDLDLQKAAVQALHDVLPKASDPEAAVVAVDPRTGDVRAMTEKKDGGYQKNGFDLARDAVRSTGSTIKPFTLAAALGSGHRLDERVFAPCTASIPNPGGAPNPYPVHNAGGENECGFTMTLRQALAYSVNTVYAPLANKIGLAHVFNVARAAGMRPESSFQGLQPAKSLGVGVTPISEAEAFATLVDHGVHHATRVVTTVRSRFGGARLDADPSPSGNRVLTAKIADQVTDAMGDVVRYGTGVAAAQPFPVYGKTGTTDDYTNAWFTGCTRQLCLTVWMGYDKPRPMRGVEGVDKVEGGTLPARIFAATYADYRAIQAQEAAAKAHPGARPSSSARPAATPSAAASAPAPAVSTAPSATPSAPTVTAPPSSPAAPPPPSSPPRPPPIVPTFGGRPPGG